MIIVVLWCQNVKEIKALVSTDVNGCQKEEVL